MFTNDSIADPRSAVDPIPPLSEGASRKARHVYWIYTHSIEYERRVSARRIAGVQFNYSRYPNPNPMAMRGICGAQ